MTTPGKHKWIPVMGEFEFAETGQDLVFKGRAIPSHAGDAAQGQSQDQTAVGQALSDQKFSEGTVSMTVEFKSFDELTSCEIMLGYDASKMSFVSAGLGGGGSMFCIRSWTPAADPQRGGWTYIASTGDRANIKPGHSYEVTVRLRGSQLNLLVNGIEILSTNLSSPLPEKNIGVLCLSKSDLNIHGFRVAREVPKAFVVMQFTPEYEDLYQSVIKPVCANRELEAFRADQAYGPGLIISDIASEIIRSKVVIAEITPANPNVYYEVGFAHAMNKPTILIADKGTRLPFDVSPLRTIFYENTIGGKERVQQMLEQFLEAILSGSSG